MTLITPHPDNYYKNNLAVILILPFIVILIPPQAGEESQNKKSFAPYFPGASVLRRTPQIGSG